MGQKSGHLFIHAYVIHLFSNYVLTPIVYQALCCMLSVHGEQDRCGSPPFQLSCKPSLTCLLFLLVSLRLHLNCLYLAWLFIGKLSLN